MGTEHVRSVSTFFTNDVAAVGARHELESPRRSLNTGQIPRTAVVRDHSTTSAFCRVACRRDSAATVRSCRHSSGQWQQSMFPMGCIGWMMATTAVPSEAAVETSAMETIAMVAAMTRRRVRALGASLFMAQSLVRAADLPWMVMTSRSRSALPDSARMADGSAVSSGDHSPGGLASDDLSRTAPYLPSLGGLPSASPTERRPACWYRRRAGDRARGISGYSDVAAVSRTGRRDLTARRPPRRAAPRRVTVRRRANPVAATHRRAAQRALPEATPRRSTRVFAVRPVVRFLRRGRLQPGDQLLGLVAGELAGGLALRETHRSTGIPEVLVTRSPEKRQQFAHLT